MKKWLFLSFFLAAFGLALYALWKDPASEISYRSMACVYEERSLQCLDSVGEWKGGLSYFDSLISKNVDSLTALKSLLWEHWNLEFIGPESAGSVDGVLPLTVLKNRKSGCMGLSWLAMMISEVRPMPLEVILLPGHVYLKYCSQKDSCVNLEPNRQGYSYTDAEYREKYREGRWTGLEFKALTPEAFLGLAAFNIGNSYLESDPRHALLWYRSAETMFPQYPGIDVNQKIAKSRL